MHSVAMILILKCLQATYPHIISALTEQHEKSQLCHINRFYNVSYQQVL